MASIGRCIDNMVTEPQIRQTAGEIFELLMAGVPAADVQPGFSRLPADEQSALLCTVCAVHEEVALNCLERALEIGALLNRNCRFFLDGARTCK